MEVMPAPRPSEKYAVALGPVHRLRHHDYADFDLGHFSSLYREYLGIMFVRSDQDRGYPASDLEFSRVLKGDLKTWNLLLILEAGQMGEERRGAGFGLGRTGPGG